MRGRGTYANSAAPQGRRIGAGQIGCKASKEGSCMSKRDLTGAVDFAYLERFALDDTKVIDEVLALFREQAALWAPMLDGAAEGWLDAVHTIKGAARGVGAFALGDACDHAEA